MPLYEYECQSCGDRVEILQRVGAPPVGECEACGGRLKRLLSAPAFQFKGTGWYVTDYAKKNASSAGESPAGKDSSSVKPKESGEAKVESKGSQGSKAKSEPESPKKTPTSS